MSEKKSKLDGNPVEHPLHYTSHKSGIEAVEIIENLIGNCCNAIKYLLRLDKKWDTLEDIQKSMWYTHREIWRRSGLTKDQVKFPVLGKDHSPSDFAFDFMTLDDYALDVPFKQVKDIKKVVECSEPRVGTAIFYIWLADKQPGIKNLCIASSYIKAEIEARKLLN